MSALILDICLEKDQLCLPHINRSFVPTGYSYIFYQWRSLSVSEAINPIRVRKCLGEKSLWFFPKCVNTEVPFGRIPYWVRSSDTSIRSKRGRSRLTSQSSLLQFIDSIRWIGFIGMEISVELRTGLWLLLLLRGSHSFRVHGECSSFWSHPMRRPVGCDAKRLRSLIRVNSVHRLAVATSQGAIRERLCRCSTFTKILLIT